MNSIEGTITITRKILGLLQIMDAGVYRKPLDIYGGSTLGQHFRHIFDFYNCLLRDGAAGLVDYAARERPVAIEADPEEARRAFEKVIDAVTGLREEQPLTVRADFSDQPGAERPEYQSSVGRELLFAYDHALHHLAIIRMGLQQAFPDYCPEDNLGMSPATIKHRMAAHPKKS